MSEGPGTRSPAEGDGVGPAPTTEGSTYTGVKGPIKVRIDAIEPEAGPTYGKNNINNS